MDRTSARQFKMRWLQLLVTSFITRSFTMFARHVFSVIADKATDVANVEQLFISVCVVDGETVCEKFLAFLKWEKGVTSEALEDTILQQLVEWQFHLHLLCGQAYDGAGTMAGKSKGVAACICTKHPKAMYITHCASYRLNLCVVKWNWATWCTQPTQFHNFSVIRWRDNRRSRSGSVMCFQRKDEEDEKVVLDTMGWAPWYLWSLSGSLPSNRCYLHVGLPL